MTSSEAIIKALTDSTKKALGPQELADIAFPLTTGLKGKNPRHSFTNNLYKEAKRPDGLLIRSTDSKGKTVFKLNPKRRPLKSEKPAVEKTTAAATKKSRKPKDGTPGPKGLGAVLNLTPDVEETTGTLNVETGEVKMDAPAPAKKRSEKKVEQLRAAYLLAFDTFATGVTEVAGALDVSKSTAARVLAELRDLGLVDSVDVNDEAQGDSRKGSFKELAWQANVTYDSINRTQAETLFNATLAGEPQDVLDLIIAG